MDIFQKELDKLKKKKKFENKTNFKPYWSNAMLPQLYVVIKTQEPEKAILWGQHCQLYKMHHTKHENM